MTLSLDRCKTVVDWLGACPDVDAFSHPDNIVRFKPAKEMLFVSSQDLNPRPENCLATNFRSVDWSQEDKNRLVWAFPPATLQNFAIQSLVKSEQPAVILVPVGSGSCEPWFPLVERTGGLISDFCHEHDKRSFTINNAIARANKKFILILTKQAKDLIYRSSFIFYDI